MSWRRKARSDCAGGRRGTHGLGGGKAEEMGLVDMGNMAHRVDLLSLSSFFFSFSFPWRVILAIGLVSPFLFFSFLLFFFIWPK